MCCVMLWSIIHSNLGRGVPDGLYVMWGVEGEEQGIDEREIRFWICINFFSVDIIS